MKKMFWITILFLSFVVPFNVNAVDLKMTFDDSVGAGANDGEYYILPSYDNSGRLDGNLIYYLMGVRRKEYSNSSALIFTVKYNLNNRLLYKKTFSDLSNDFQIDVDVIEKNNNSGYIVKGDKDVLISIYDNNISSNTPVFTRQYGGNGIEKGYRQFESYDNDGVRDGYIILVISNSTDLGVDPGFILLKYDLKGNLLWQKNVNEYFSDYYVVDGQINTFLKDYVYGDGYVISRYDAINENELWKINPDLAGVDNITLSYTKDGVVDGIVVAGCANVEDKSGWFGTIVKYDLDGKEVFRNNYDKPSFYYNVISSKYIDETYDGYIVVGMSDEGAFVLKYNYDGKLIYKDIYSKKYYVFSEIANNYDNTGKQNGYIILSSWLRGSVLFEPQSFGFNTQIPVVKKLNNVKKMAADANLLTIVKYTYPIYDIVKDKTDEGEITVGDNAYPGDIVKVKVTPKEGYVLKRIVVKDENGKEIEVSKDGTFVMPEGKVTVTAIYSRITNPETVSACYVVLGIILLISIGTLVVQKKKENV